jgi:hypothetical protein
MKKTVILMVFVLFALTLKAQDGEVLRAALYLCGASTEEELDATVLDRLEGLRGRPIRINKPSRRARELLSAYQIASLEDYRRSHGDILSWEELALVDGFGRDAVAALRPFLSLASETLPGAVDTLTRRKRQLLMRITEKNWGAKYKSSGERYQAGVAWRGRDGTFHADIQLGQHRLLLGDYNARFGQGAAHWSGFAMESLSSLDAFVRRSTGLRPAWSFSHEGLHRGGAWEYAGGAFQGAIFADAAGTLGLHAEGLWRSSQLGFTALLERGGPIFSLDGRWNWKGMDLAGELAWKNRSLGGKLASSWKASDAVRLALQMRVLPSRFTEKKNGEYSLAAGAGFASEKRVTLSGKTGFGSSVQAFSASLTADVALLPKPATGETGRFQLRSYMQARWQMNPRWALSFRFTERYRNYEPARSDVRMDVLFGHGLWSATLRSEFAYCHSPAVLTYLEGGYKNDTLSAYFRLTGFGVSHWDARIYCYERDAPGSFSVPAYNGKGMVASLVSSWKHRFPRWFTLKLYLRAACTFRIGQSPAPNLHLQLQLER